MWPEHRGSQIGIGDCVRWGIGHRPSIGHVFEGLELHSVTLYANPSMCETNRTGDVIPFSIPGYLHFLNNNRTFEAFGGHLLDLEQFSVFGDGEPLQVHGSLILPSTFEALGTLPQLGRFPRPGEAVSGPDGPGLVLLSHGLWVRRFGADPSIIGRTIRLNDTFSEVIGVMPEGFAFPSPDVSLWIPYAEDLDRNRRVGNHIMLVVARLAPGVTIEAAVADAESLIRRFTNRSSKSTSPARSRRTCAFSSGTTSNTSPESRGRPSSA